MKREEETLIRGWAISKTNWLHYIIDDVTGKTLCGKFMPKAHVAGKTGRKCPECSRILDEDKRMFGGG